VEVEADIGCRAATHRTGGLPSTVRVGPPDSGSRRGPGAQNFAGFCIRPRGEGPRAMRSRVRAICLVVPPGVSDYRADDERNSGDDCDGDYEQYSPTCETHDVFLFELVSENVARACRLAASAPKQATAAKTPNAIRTTTGLLYTRHLCRPRRQRVCIAAPSSLTLGSSPSGPLVNSVATMYKARQPLPQVISVCTFFGKAALHTVQPAVARVPDRAVEQRPGDPEGVCGCPAEHHVRSRRRCAGRLGSGRRDRHGLLLPLLGCERACGAVRARWRPFGANPRPFKSILVQSSSGSVRWIQ
jgi:hypothetical protein